MCCCTWNSYTQHGLFVLLTYLCLVTQAWIFRVTLDFSLYCPYPSSPEECLFFPPFPCWEWALLPDISTVAMPSLVTSCHLISPVQSTLTGATTLSFLKFCFYSTSPDFQRPHGLALKALPKPVPNPLLQFSLYYPTGILTSSPIWERSKPITCNPV